MPAPQDTSPTSPVAVTPAAPVAAAPVAAAQEIKYRLPKQTDDPFIKFLFGSDLGLFAVVNPNLTETHMPPDHLFGDRQHRLGMLKRLFEWNAEDWPDSKIEVLSKYLKETGGACWADNLLARISLVRARESPHPVAAALSQMVAWADQPFSIEPAILGVASGWLPILIERWNHFDSNTGLGPALDGRKSVWEVILTDLLIAYFRLSLGIPLESLIMQFQSLAEDIYGKSSFIHRRTSSGSLDVAFLAGQITQCISLIVNDLDPDVRAVVSSVLDNADVVEAIVRGTADGVASKQEALSAIAPANSSDELPESLPTLPDPDEAAPTEAFPTIPAEAAEARVFDNPLPLAPTDPIRAAVDKIATLDWTAAQVSDEYVRELVGLVNTLTVPEFHVPWADYSAREWLRKRLEEIAEMMFEAYANVRVWTAQGRRQAVQHVEFFSAQATGALANRGYPQVQFQEFGDDHFWNCSAGAACSYALMLIWLKAYELDSLDAIVDWIFEHPNLEPSCYISLSRNSVHAERVGSCEEEIRALVRVLPTLIVGRISSSHSVFGAGLSMRVDTQEWRVKIKTGSIATAPVFLAASGQLGTCDSRATEVAEVAEGDSSSFNFLTFQSRFADAIDGRPISGGLIVLRPPDCTDEMALDLIRQGVLYQVKQISSLSVDSPLRIARLQLEHLLTQINERIPELPNTRPITHDELDALRSMCDLVADQMREAGMPLRLLDDVAFALVRGRRFMEWQALSDDELKERIAECQANPTSNDRDEQVRKLHAGLCAQNLRELHALLQARLSGVDFCRPLPRVAMLPDVRNRQREHVVHVDDLGHARAVMAAARNVKLSFGPVCKVDVMRAFNNKVLVLGCNVTAEASRLAAQERWSIVRCQSIERLLEELARDEASWQV